LLQPDVVVHGHPREFRDLLPPQARGSTARPGLQPNIGGLHERPAVTEEGRECGAVEVIHTPMMTRFTEFHRGIVDTSLKKALPLWAGGCDRDGMTETQKDIILITGANKGIGFATARAFAHTGHAVFLGARDTDRGTAAAATLAADRLNVRFVRLDVTDADTVTAAAALIETDYGRLDLLVNNAGISRDRPHTPTELPTDRLRETYETNVFGVVTVINTMLPLLRKSASGRIANISSSLGSIASLSNPDAPIWQYANLLAYNSSKTALNAITLIYAQSLRSEGITVNAIDPGYVATNLNNNAGYIPADEAGESVARELTKLDASVTGAFLTLNGETQLW
jgi:NAD(P)-dependent dehydrogenase (short-subunit alcohol dehydrogenase family)